MRYTVQALCVGREGYCDDARRPRWVMAAYMDVEPTTVFEGIVFNAKD